MTAYETATQKLRQAPTRWLVTGAAGFIGSHLVETLLKLDQSVVGLDNFATGKRTNLDQVRQAVSKEQWARFTFIEGDIADPETCLRACQDVHIVLHQAALGSVPRSIEEPLTTHRSNVTGFLNMLDAARRTGVKRFVYASSSAVYGDDPNLPKVEHRIGKPLSPYAASKLMNEIYAGVFGRLYGIETIGLRYFNVFGQRQDPSGPYAAVIPRWISKLVRGDVVEIYGDGLTSRDFCYVANVVQANILAATTSHPEAINTVFNVAVGSRTTLNELFQAILSVLRNTVSGLREAQPVYREFRPGDVRHSQADLTRARSILGYEPTHTLEAGLRCAIKWYLQNTA